MKTYFVSYSVLNSRYIHSVYIEGDEKYIQNVGQEFYFYTILARHYGVRLKDVKIIDIEKLSNDEKPLFSNPKPFFRTLKGGSL